MKMRRYSPQEFREFGWRDLNTVIQQAMYEHGWGIIRCQKLVPGVSPVDLSPGGGRDPTSNKKWIFSAQIVEELLVVVADQIRGRANERDVFVGPVVEAAFKWRVKSRKRFSTSAPEVFH
jgi:hypothetical protein